MAERIILRHPDGVSVFETDDTNLMQDFINWIIRCNHYSEYDEKNGIFTFPHSKFTPPCSIKWQKLRCS